MDKPYKNIIPSKLYQLVAELTVFSIQQKIIHLVPSEIILIISKQNGMFNYDRYGIETNIKLLYKHDVYETGFVHPKSINNIAVKNIKQLI